MPKSPDNSFEPGMKHEPGKGNQILESQFQAALKNSERGQLSDKIKREIITYLNRYPDYQDMILKNICPPGWNIDKVKQVLGIS